MLLNIVVQILLSADKTIKRFRLKTWKRKTEKVFVSLISHPSLQPALQQIPRQHFIILNVCAFDLIKSFRFAFFFFFICCCFLFIVNHSNEIILVGSMKCSSMKCPNIRKLRCTSGFLKSIHSLQ